MVLDCIYLSVVLLGAISSIVLLLRLRERYKRLPNGWKNTQSLKRFRLSIFCLGAYLTTNFIGEFSSICLARQGIYNGFMVSIVESILIPFAFGFFLLNTSVLWKRYLYVVLYLFLLIYLISNGHYHPDSVLGSISSLLFNLLYILGALIHVSDLLVKPHTDHFKFQLRISLSFIIFCILSCILTTAFNYGNLPDSIYQTHYWNIILFYSSLVFILIREIRKLHRMIF